MRSVNCCYLYLSARSPMAGMALQRLLSQAEGTGLKGAGTFPACPAAGCC